MGWACKRAARTSRNANVVDSGAVLVEQPLDRIPCNNRIIEVTLISAVQSHSHEMVVGDLTGFDRRVREQPVTHAHSATRASDTGRDTFVAQKYSGGSAAYTIAEIRSRPPRMAPTTKAAVAPVFLSTASSLLT